MAKKNATVDDRAGTVTKDELQQVERANASGKVPVVFVHGLWLLPSSWDRWAKVFEAAGFTRRASRLARRPRHRRRGQGPPRGRSPASRSATSPTTSRASSASSTASRP